MGNERTITGIALTENEACIAIVDPVDATGEATLARVARFPLNEGSSIAERLGDLEANLYALGCDQQSLVWVASALPEMSFATVTVEKMALKKLAPLAWLKFQKEVENLPEKVVFDFEVPETESTAVVPMWDLAAFATPYDEVEAIEGWFGERFKLQGITMDMFACRTLLARSETGEEAVALLSCEQNICRIMLVKGGHTVFTRTIKTGSATLLEHVERDLERQVPVEKVATILNMPESEYLVYIDPDKARIVKACTTGADRLFTQVGRAIDYYTTHLKNQRPQKLFLSGNVELLKRFIPELSNRLMLDVQLLDPASAGILFSEEASASLSEAGAERYSPAIGAVLGQSGGTPNLICTHDVKERLEKTTKIRTLVASGFIGLATLLFIGLFWQLNQVRGYSAELKNMESSPAKGLLHVTTGYADLKVDEIKRKKEEALLLIERYRLVSALMEVQTLTPEGIVIKNMILKADPKSRTGLVLEGVVIDINGSAAIHLAKYVVDLNTSPMFSQVLIISQSDFEADPALRRKGVLPFKVEGLFVADLSEEKG